MARRSHLLALFIMIAAPAFAEDTAPVASESTFEDRLKAAKFIGLEVDSELGAYIVRSYSEAQFNQKQVSQQEYIKDRDEYRKRRDEHQDRMQELSSRMRATISGGASSEDRSALHRELAETQRATPKAPPRQNIVELYRVVEVGVDYLAARPAADSDETALIPFSRIGKFVRVADESENRESLLQQAAPAIAALEAAIQGKAHPEPETFIAQGASWEGIRPLAEIVTDPEAQTDAFPDDSQLRWMTLEKTASDPTAKLMIPDEFFPAELDRDRTIFVIRDIKTNSVGKIFRIVYWFGLVEEEWKALFGTDGWGPAEPLRSLSDPVPPELFSGNAGDPS